MLHIYTTAQPCLRYVLKKGEPCCRIDVRLLACEQDADRIQELFGFSEEEEVMESFEVKLRQTLSCTHNSFTSPQEVEH